MMIMPRVGISRIVISTHSHDTEDIDKVEQALFNIFPPSLRSRISIVRETIHGFYGNIINRLKIMLEGSEAIEFLKHLFNVLSNTDKNIIINTIESRYSRKSNELFIRLNKQEAYLGIVTLYEGDDAIKISISFSIQRSVEAVRELLNSLVKGSINVF